MSKIIETRIKMSNKTTLFSLISIKKLKLFNNCLILSKLKINTNIFLARLKFRENAQDPFVRNFHISWTFYKNIYFQMAQICAANFFINQNKTKFTLFKTLLEKGHFGAILVNQTERLRTSK